jgi:hypothetical protein
VPHIHDQHGEPRIERILRVVVVDAELRQGVAGEADVLPSEDLPDRADDIPRDEERHREQHEHQRCAPALRGHGQRERNAERDLDGEHRGREDQLT